jgi:DNA modification methylase
LLVAPCDRLLPLFLFLILPLNAPALPIPNLREVRIALRPALQEGIRNLITMGNNDSNGDYLSGRKGTEMKPHPVRFPVQLPKFFIKFLTTPGDLILDPFFGSCTTGEATERQARRWICAELVEIYLDGARFRFENEAFDAPRRILK